MYGNHGTIIQIGDVLVSEEVVTEFFCCDYSKCRGCCCIVGDSGAPLKEEEVPEIEALLDDVRHLMTPSGINAVVDKGVFDIDRDGDMVTATVQERHLVEGLDHVPGASAGIGVQGLEECAFVSFEKQPDGSTGCLCALEKEYSEARGKFIKPLSCRLYPIRVKRLRSGADALNYHSWSICSDAVENGKKKGVRVYQFLRPVLEETYGKEFYEALEAAAKYINK
mgnify:CR=1 FL=1